MKIYFVLVLLLLLFTNTFSQNIEKLKRSDTIYVYFDDNKPNQIHHKDLLKHKNLDYDTYYFQINSLSSLEFTHHYRIAKERRYEKRCFLKKNKDITVNYMFLKNLGFVDAVKLFYSESGKKKKIYIIEKKSIGWFKIFLKEVTNHSLYPIYDE